METYSEWYGFQDRKFQVPKMEVLNFILLVISNIFYFHPYLGKISSLTNIFRMGWNHQPVIFGYFVGGFSIKPYPYSFLLVRIDPTNLVTFCEPSFSWVFKETNMQGGGKAHPWKQNIIFPSLAMYPSHRLPSLV